MLASLPLDVHQPPAHVQVAHQGSHAPSTHSKKAAKESRKTPTRTLRTRTIGAGESIYSIARTEHTTVAAIVKANSGLNPHHIVPGTKIKVPTPAAKPTPHATKSSAAKKPAQQAYAPKPTHVPTYAGTAAAKGYSPDQVRAGDADRKELATRDLPNQGQIRSMVTATAKRYGVSPQLALGISMQESGFNQSAVSVCDAIGTMQVMPETGEWASHIVGKRLDIKQAQDNITAGVTTLRYLTTHAKDQDEAIGAYYQGLGAMQEHGPYSDTKHYIASVKSHMAGFTHE